MPSSTVQLNFTATDTHNEATFRGLINILYECSWTAHNDTNLHVSSISIEDLNNGDWYISKIMIGTSTSSNWINKSPAGSIHGYGDTLTIDIDEDIIDGFLQDTVDITVYVWATYEGGRQYGTFTTNVSESITRSLNEHAELLCNQGNPVPYQRTNVKFTINTTSALGDGYSINSYRLLCSQNNYSTYLQGTSNYSGIINSSITKSYSNICNAVYKNALSSTDTDKIFTFELIGYSLSPGSTPSDEYIVSESILNLKLYGVYRDETFTVDRVVYSRLKLNTDEYIGLAGIKHYNANGGGRQIKYLKFTKTPGSNTTCNISYKNGSWYSDASGNNIYAHNVIGTYWTHEPDGVSFDTVINQFKINVSAASNNGLVQITLTGYNDTYNVAVNLTLDVGTQIVLSSVYKDYFDDTPKELYIGSRPVKGVFSGNKQVWPPIKTVYLKDPTCYDTGIKLTVSGRTVTSNKSRPNNITLYYTYAVSVGTAYYEEWVYYPGSDEFPAGTTSLTLSHFPENGCWFANDQTYMLLNGNYYYFEGAPLQGYWRFTLKDIDDNTLNVGSTKIYSSDNAFTITYAWQQTPSVSSYVSRSIPSDAKGTTSFCYMQNQYLYLCDKAYLPLMPADNTSLTGITTSSNLTPSNCLGYYPSGYLTNKSAPILAQYYKKLSSGDDNKVNLFDYGVIKNNLTTYRYELANNTMWYADKGAIYEWDYSSSYMSVTVYPSGTNYTSDFRIFQPIFVDSSFNKIIFLKAIMEDCFGTPTTDYRTMPDTYGVTTSPWDLSELTVESRMNICNLSKTINTNLGSSPFTLDIHLYQNYSWYYSGYDVYCQYYLKASFVKAWSTISDATNSNAKRYFSSLAKPTSLSDTKTYHVYLPYYSGYGTKNFTWGMKDLGTFTLRAKTASSTNTYLKRGTK